jgi:hypothetical protein
MRGPASAPLAFDSLAGPCPSSGGPRAAPTVSRRRACVVPPRCRSPSTRSSAPVRPQADRALRRRSLVGAHAWSRLDAARLRLARRTLPVLRRTARCADGFSSARMRGPASAPLAFDSLAGPCPSSGGPRAASTASRRRACVVPPRTACLRLARRTLPALRRTARCADGLLSARMRGPASTPLAFSSLAAPVRPQADRALRRRPLFGAHAWSRLDAARLQLARRPVRPQADRALRRPPLIGAHAWSRLGTARLRLAPSSVPLRLLGSFLLHTFFYSFPLSPVPCTHLLHFEPRGSRTSRPRHLPFEEDFRVTAARPLTPVVGSEGSG